MARARRRRGAPKTERSSRGLHNSISESNCSFSIEALPYVLFFQDLGPHDEKINPNPRAETHRQSESIHQLRSHREYCHPPNSCTIMAAQAADTKHSTLITPVYTPPLCPFLTALASLLHSCSDGGEFWDRPRPLQAACHRARVLCVPRVSEQGEGRSCR